MYSLHKQVLPRQACRVPFDNATLDIQKSARDGRCNGRRSRKVASSRTDSGSLCRIGVGKRTGGETGKGLELEKRDKRELEFREATGSIQNPTGVPGYSKGVSLKATELNTKIWIGRQRYIQTVPFLCALAKRHAAHLNELQTSESRDIENFELKKLDSKVPLQ